VGFLSSAWARGVSPYLPQKISPDMDRKIARVLLLGDKVAIRKPIAAAIVFDALPKACKRDPVLCEEVRRYLNRFMHTAGITDLQVGLAAANGDSLIALT
jgi:hypothetical protein